MRYYLCALGRFEGRSLPTGKLHTWVLAFVCAWGLSSCLDDDFTADSTKKIRLSTDTLSFDTVFTSIGSANRHFKIYNPHKEFILLKSIKLAKGLKSPFRMNVDGISAHHIANFELLPQDSIYVFCDITVNPDDPIEISPFIVTDSIIIEYNGNKAYVLLVCWGQNANYLPSKLNKGNVTVIDLQQETWVWDDPKPYIIFGIVYVHNGILQIPPGTKVYFWGGITKGTDPDGEMFFYNDGRLMIGPDASLIAAGTFDNIIVFRSVRTEPSFDKISGQWSGIFLGKHSQNNRFDFCHFRNSLVGLYMDSLSAAVVNNCRFMYTSTYGIFGQAIDLQLNNSLFFGQGAESLHLVLGGKVEANYCTFANYGNARAAVLLSNRWCLDLLCEQSTVADLQAIISNCAIAGSDDDELQMIYAKSAGFRVLFDHCMLRSTKLHTIHFPDFFQNYSRNSFVYTSQKNLFKNLNENDFRPDSISVLDKKAIPLPGLLFDIENKLRDGIMPDIGCFEGNN